MVTDEKLKPFGWLPGHYMFTCIDCPEDQHSNPTLGLDYRFAAKGAWRCQQHAEDAYTLHYIM